MSLSPDLVSKKDRMIVNILDTYETTRQRQSNRGPLFKFVAFDSVTYQKELMHGIWSLV